MGGLAGVMSASKMARRTALDTWQISSCVQKLGGGKRLKTEYFPLNLVSLSVTLSSGFVEGLYWNKVHPDSLKSSTPGLLQLSQADKDREVEALSSHPL